MSEQELSYLLLKAIWEKLTDEPFAFSPDIPASVILTDLHKVVIELHYSIAKIVKTTEGLKQQIQDDIDRWIDSAL